MAYGDYGAFVYKNDKRRRDKEDVLAFNLTVETFAVDIDPAELALWKFTQPEVYNKVFNYCDNMYHGVCGDGPIRVACYKQGLPRIFESTADEVKVIPYYDPDKTDRYDFGQLKFEYKGYNFHFEAGNLSEPYIAEMYEPDGTHWYCAYDYEYGAGFEDKDEDE